jgi:hypothetical protein
MFVTPKEKSISVFGFVVTTIHHTPYTHSHYPMTSTSTTDQNVTCTKKTRAPKQQTVYQPGLLNGDTCKDLYQFLANNIPWEDGIKSTRKGFTRKAKAMDVLQFMLMLDQNGFSDILMPIFDTIQAHSNRGIVCGVYLNYYRDGNMWTPQHSHAKMTQLVVSLGATRCLTVASKEYKMSNGDVIVFGSSTHGVAKDDSKEGRISIALFLTDE